MALFGNQLFVTNVLSSSTNQIGVYDTTTFQRLYNVTVPGATGSLTGLVISPANNYLYLCDMTYSKLYKITLSSALLGNPAIVSWSVSGPVALSVNSQLNVLVTTASNMVQEYTPDGKLVRQINDVCLVWQAVEVNNRTWAVSRSCPFEVCLMFINGTVSYCSATGLLDQPMNMAVDSHGYILVADSFNDRIVVLSPNLSDYRNLTLPVGPPVAKMIWPGCVIFDEARCRLYVGELAGPSRLLVYDNVCNLSDAFTP